MPTDPLLLADFRSHFKGSEHNYGLHQYRDSKDGEKEEGKSKTVRDTLLTNEQYKAHLEGKTGLGVIPIGDDNKCHFCVIDVDLYTRDLTPYVQSIERNNFPLIPFRSKSGGLHLYLFFRVAVAATTAVELMRQLVSLLSIDLLVKQEQNKIVEIFPKQTRLNKDSVGSWINLPYFNSDKTIQYAWRGGKALSLSEALTYIKENRTTAKDVKAFIEDMPFNDGPPCLQSIFTLNPLTKGSGGRNVYLFSFGVYLKKKDEKLWQQKLHEINASMPDPLPEDELERTIISSLERKDYTYKCFEHPCLTFCDKGTCKTKEYGIGKEGGYFSELEFGKMFQIRTGAPYYEWEVKQQDSDKFLKLRFQNEDEIIKQDVFLRLCFRELRILPVKMKQVEWFKLVNQALIEIEVTTVVEEDDTSPITLLRSLVADWIMNREEAANRDQILNRRVFFDEQMDRYLFRTKDLLEFIFINKGFRYYTPSEIHGFIHDLRGRSVRVRTEQGRQFRVTAIPKDEIVKIHGSNGVSEEVFEVDFEALDEKKEY